MHGAIDGYSRLITFLRCSNDNRAETVLDCFIEAAQEYGLPSRVRTDYGGENVRVWDYMEECRGTGRGSFLTGKSVHNSRIERLWRDVYRLVSSSYAHCFHQLEDMGALNPSNEADMFALHFVFLPRINNSLDTFKLGWNNHQLSTENNLSPLQLYTAYAQGSHLFDDHSVDGEMYGREDNEDERDDENELDINEVVVPNTHIPLSTSSIERLSNSINPLSACNDFGKQFYLDTVNLLYTLMLNDGLI